MTTTNDSEDQDADTESEESVAETDQEILDESRDRYRACQDANSANRSDALDDLLFLVGGENQWDPRAVMARKADGRPIITVNTLPTYLHQVTNDQRHNTPSIKIHSVGDGADVETAKVRQGMIKHIEYDSNAATCYDTAVNSSAAIGFGYFRLVTEFIRENSFEQKIMFKRIRNALSVKIDPLSIEMDGSDMKYCFIDCLYPKQEFRREYPDAKASDPAFFGESVNQYAGWLTEDTVLVCEYYRIKQEEAEVVLLSNGESGYKDDLLELPEGVTIVKTRRSTRSKVLLHKITGCDVLETTEIKCNWIPVFPVYGDEIDIEGKVTRSGIIRHAKGPCKSYNVMMSGATEEIALRSKAPFVGGKGQFKGFEEDWMQANNRAFPYLEYNPVSLDGHILPPPQRQPMADIPTGFLAMAMHASDNVKKTTGLFDASLGARGNATSGKQEIAQQKEGDMANFHYSDNLNKSIVHAGRCINCMFPHYYNTPRVVQIMRDDNKVDYAKINQPVKNPQPDPETGAIKAVLHDMTCGEFSSTVEAGPSYTTMRQESAEFFANAIQAAKDPATSAVVTYLAMKNQDVPGGEEAARMLKKLIPPGIAEPDKGDPAPVMVNTPHGPIPLPEAEQAIAQLYQQTQAMHEALQKVDQSKQQLDLLKQQQIMNEQKMEPAKMHMEQQKLQAEMQKAQAAQISAEADLVRAHAEAQQAPIKAQADLHKQSHDQIMAEAHLMNAQQKLQVDAAVAEAESLSGNMEALEVWKSTLEAETKIRVAEIAARASAARQTQSKGAKNAVST